MLYFSPLCSFPMYFSLHCTVLLPNVLLCFSPMRVNRTIRLGGQFTLVHSMSAPGVNKLLVSLIDSVLHNTAINSKLQHTRGFRWCSWRGNWHSADIYASQCEPCFSVRLSGNLNKNCRQRNRPSALLRKELHKVLTKWMCPVLENMYIVHKIDPIVQIHICNFEQMPVSACLV